MPVTLKEARDLLRVRLDEPSPRRWQDHQLNAWINEGCRDVARRAECLHSEGTIAVLANVQTISLSTLTGLTKVNRVEWQTTGDSAKVALEYRDFNNMDAVWFDHQSVTKGRPDYYTLKGTPPSLSCVVYPTPSQAGTLRVHYWRVPADAGADATTLDLPEGWSDIVLDYAESRALRRDGNPEWKAALETYKDNLAALVETTRRYTDASTVISPEVGHLPAWLVDEFYGGW